MIKRYECFTGYDATNYEATVTDDGPWVSYDDHAEAMQKLWRTADTRERMNSQTIATLRAENDRLADEAYNARQSAKGENALRLRADDDHAEGIADLRALAREAVKEAYAEAFDDAWDLARGLDADDDLIQECWLKSGAECDFKEGKA
jgi:hypothetical protein